MTRFWTCHWQFRYWRPDINREGQPICSCGSNTFTKRGVSVGDIVYVISLSKGQLYLGGRMTVKRVVSRRQALHLLRNDNLYDAREWIVDPDQTGTPLHLHRRLSPVLTKQLRFRSRKGPQEPCFISDTDLDNQATRGVRELTRESAKLLDGIIDATDRLPESNRLLTVTQDMIPEAESALSEEFRLPDEVLEETHCVEGSLCQVRVNRYERDPQARRICLAVNGTTCCICEFDFGATYGPEANGYIHVHHLRPLSEIGHAYVIDPEKELRPVCPNCHAVIHMGGQCRSVAEVKRLLKWQKGR